MRKRESPHKLKLKLTVPPPTSTISDFFTASGTFRDGDILLNRDGLRVLSQASTSSSAAEEADITLTLEDLEIINVLGKGASGMVQLVRHKWTGQLFALKAIQMNIQEEIRKQIVTELRINRASQGPYVVMYYHAFYDNGVLSILLEYMDRGSLADVLKHYRRLSEPCLAVICRQVLRGVMFLHCDVKIVHRDIKPSNLLLNHKGEVKITDFGVSACLTNSMSQRASFVGTCFYMSPERIMGNKYGLTSDIWSLGLVLLECAVGYFPYVPAGQNKEWDNFYELIDTIVGQPAPCASPDYFSPEFCSFISCCIQKEPEDRSSAIELLNHPFILKYESEGNDVLADLLQDWSSVA